MRLVPALRNGENAQVSRIREGRTVRLTPGADGVGADFLIVGSEYFDTIGLRLLRGREFTRAEEDPVAAASGPAAGAPVIIDRLLSKKLFNDAEPLGQRVLIQQREGEAPQPFGSRRRRGGNEARHLRGGYEAARVCRIRRFDRI